MMKVTVLYGHPADPQAFETYYASTHLPLAAKIKGVTRVELTRFAPGQDGSKPAFYRMAELYFPTEGQMQSSLGSAEGRAAVADIANFADGGATMLTGSVDG